MIFLNIIILIAAFLALIKGADIFVESSSELARFLKIPDIVIGLTIVAVGTSLPELAVSTSAAIKGANEIALSNVVGSNIFNLLGILGICALIKPLTVDNIILKRDFPISVFSTIFIFFTGTASIIFKKNFFTLNMQAYSGIISRWLGIVITILFIAYIAYLIFTSKKFSSETKECIEKKYPLWKCLLLLAAGLILTVAGGKAVVYSAQNIARFFGMSETLIGLTIVAIGTSLPELVTSIIATKKGQVSLVVGNILGSNIFNPLFILGISAIIHPVSINAASAYDMLILIFITIISWIFSFTKRSIGRTEGIIMILFYCASTVFAGIR